MQESSSLSDINAELPQYKDPGLPIDIRVNDLLSRMTLDEKIAQMSCIWDDKQALIFDSTGRFDPEMVAKNLPDGIGQIARISERKKNCHISNYDAREMAELANSIQQAFIEKTRLGIPVIFHEECLHGLMAKGGTSFPIPIALASTWDDELIEQVFTAVAEEMRSRGGHQALTPVIDVAREPRWGRFEETFGEDPYLVSRMGVSVVNGLQGKRSLADNQRIDNQHVGATLKHFACHGQPESGMNAGPGNYSLRIVREVVFPPFKACVTEANALSVMPSYNEIDGVPSHANAWLLNDVLRTEWGFQGVVVADYFGIQQLYERHCVASGPVDAARLALSAGVDIEQPDRVCYPALKDLVNEEKISIALIDKSVARILKAKFQLGLFESPFVDVNIAEYVACCERNRQLARKTAEKAIALLKNDGNLLPLSTSKYKSIGVIGPNADKILLGGYSDQPSSPVSLLEGIKRRVNGESEILYSEGCQITEPGDWFQDDVKLSDPLADEQKMNDAVIIAQKCDVVIVAVGGNELVSREAWAEKHLGDSSTLDLIGKQNELVRRIVDTGKPVVVVLFHGRPQSVCEIKEKVPAILDCWYLGQESGNAVAGVLFGDTTPGGKLAVTIPRSAGHLPAFYNHKPTARRGFLFDDVTPLFPFGYGLSYTTFSFGIPKLARSKIKKDESTSVSVQICNTGNVAGDEVVQMYIRDCVSSVTRPVKELKGYKRITLKPGEKTTVVIDITPEKMAFYDIAMNYVVEPGEFEIMIGNSSQDKDLQKTMLEVVE